MLRELIGHDFDVGCAFLDNSLHMLSRAELEEAYSAELPQLLAAFDESLEAIRRAAAVLKPFRCADLECTLAERDVGRDRIEREAAAVALALLFGQREERDAERDEHLLGVGWRRLGQNRRHHRAPAPRGAAHTASKYSIHGYVLRLSSRPISITGMILVDLESVGSGKETYRSAWYWPYEESELERLHGAKENSGAGTCTLPCCSTIAAAMREHDPPQQPPSSPRIACQLQARAIPSQCARHGGNTNCLGLGFGN